MTKHSSIARLAAALHEFAIAECDAFSLIEHACSLCEDRPHDRCDVVRVIRTFLSWGLDYCTWAHCTECGEEFHPAPRKALARSARQYVDFVMDECGTFSDPFHVCKACGGRLPFGEIE